VAGGAFVQTSLAAAVVVNPLAWQVALGDIGHQHVEARSETEQWRESAHFEARRP
jgi:hypothetical protein